MGPWGGTDCPSLCPQFLFVSLRRREATYQLLKSLCRHLQVGSVLGRGRALCPLHPTAAFLVQDDTWSPPASPLNHSSEQSPTKSLVRERPQRRCMAPGGAFGGKCGAQKPQPPASPPPILQQIPVLLQTSSHSDLEQCTPEPDGLLEQQGERPPHCAPHNPP